MGQKVVLARTDRALVHSFSDKRVGRVDVQARMLLSSDEVCSEKPPHMRRLAKFAAEDAIDIAAPAVDLLNIGASPAESVANLSGPMAPESGDQARMDSCCAVAAKDSATRCET